MTIMYKLRKNEKILIGTYDSEYSMRHKLTKEAFRTLRLYPIVYFFVIMFPAINRLQNIIHGSTETDAYIFLLVLLHCLTDPIDGLGITLAFFLDKRTRHLLNRKSIKEAWRGKFKDHSKIHEWKLKSGLSSSDFVLEPLPSNSSVERTNESAFRDNEEKGMKDKTDGPLQTMSDAENGFKVPTSSKSDHGRLLSNCFEKEKKVVVSCSGNISINNQDGKTDILKKGGSTSASV